MLADIDKIRLFDAIVEELKKPENFEVVSDTTGIGYFKLHIWADRNRFFSSIEGSMYKSLILDKKKKV